MARPVTAPGSGRTSFGGSAAQTPASVAAGVFSYTLTITSGALDASGLTYEIVYVLDGVRRNAREQLTELKDEGASIKIVQLGKGFGEATASIVGIGSSGRAV